MNNNELVWNYTEMKPQISVKKQNNTNFQINIKNNKTAELYETIFNTSTCNSDVFAWKDCDDITLEKILKNGLSNGKFNNINCITIISSIYKVDEFLNKNCDEIFYFHFLYMIHF